MYYSAKNCKVTLNNREFIVSDLQLAFQAQIGPSYLAENRHSLDFRPENGIGGQLNLTYLLTGADYIKTLLDDDTAPISGWVGGLSFSSGYLRSYSFSAEPNKSIPVQAEISFFDDLEGIFLPTFEKINNFTPLLISDARISDLSNGKNGPISGLSSFNYQYNSDVQPVYHAGDTVPNRISFGEREITAELQTDGITGYLPITGSDAALTLRLNNNLGNVENYSISGKLFAREISTSNKELIRNSISIKQNSISTFPRVTYFENGSVIPGQTTFIYGTDLETVYAVYFGDVRSQKISYSASASRISVDVPSGIINDNITVLTYGGSVTPTSGYSVDNASSPSSPLIIRGITPLTGFVGGTIKISGENFYRISDVTFASNVSATNFSVINNNNIVATTPINAAWGTISVLSTTRDLTGTTNSFFVPVPTITGFSPNTGLSGTSVLIGGYGFSGITGVKFNNLPTIAPGTAPFTVNNNNSITATVTSGNVFGYISLYGRSGVFSRSIDLFYPHVNLTGINPLTGVTGQSITLIGNNFFPELMYDVEGTSKYFLASVGGATGYFGRVNSFNLTGIIPAAANSGFVNIYDSNLDPYPSNVIFYLQYGQPIISGLVPQSGKLNQHVQVQGYNLFNTTGIRLSGLSDQPYITGTGLSTSTLGDLVSFYVPLLSGRHYNVIIETNHGRTTGFSGTFQGFYGLKCPTISGFNPISGGIGGLITLTGTNIYHNSRIYFNNSGVEAKVISGSTSGSFNHIQFYIPIGASGQSTVILNNSICSATGVTYVTLINRPTISGFNPLSGEWGNVITVSGRFLNQVTGVYIGLSGSGLSSGIPFTNIDASNFSFNIPNNSNSDYIYAFGPGGFGQSSLPLFTYPPFIALSGLGFSPTGIRVNRTLLISGGNLDTTTEILFSGNNNLNILSVTGFTKVGSSGIYVTVPAQTTSGRIVLVNPRGQTTGNFLDIIPPPLITYVSNSYGIYATNLTISGTNFTGMRFYFNSANSGIHSGLISGENQVLTASTGVTLRVPKNIVFGSIHISGDNEIFFDRWSGNFFNLPTVSGFFPTGALTGTIITISGVNAVNINKYLFATGAGGLKMVAELSGHSSQITGNGVLSAESGYSLWSGIINQNYAGFGNLFITTKDIDDTIIDVPTLTGSRHFSYINLSTNQFFFNHPSPIITGIFPIRGGPNTLVSISGYFIRSITGIYINNTLGTIKSTVSGNPYDIIQFNPPNLPADTSGQITGVSQFGRNSSVNYFTFINAPFLSGFTPMRGTVATNVRLSGSDFQYISGIFWGEQTGAFTKGLENSTYFLTGIVPDVQQSLPRRLTIRVTNEAGSSTTGDFIVYNSGAILKYRTPNSDLRAIPAINGQLLFSHGFPSIPDSANIVLVCQNSEFGYSAGDEVNLDETSTNSIAGASPFSISKDTTNIVLSHQFQSYPQIEIFNKSNGMLTTGGLNSGNWKLRAVGTYQFD